MDDVCGSMDKKKSGDEVKGYFVKIEESDIPYGPLIKNHVKLIDAED